MKFKEFLTERVDELLHLTFANGVDYTVTLRLLGKDGDDRRVFVGRCLIKEKKNPDFQNDSYAAMVFRDDGSLLADKHYDTQEAAVKHAALAISGQRKGYGPNWVDKSKDWNTHFRGNPEVEGWR